MQPIPKRLQTEQYRFIKLKGYSKVPLEKNWQSKNNYLYDAPEIQNHSGNIGIVCGYGNLRVIDADDKEFFSQLLKELPITLTAKTKRGYHFYFISDLNENYRLKFKGKPAGEYRATNQQCVIYPLAISAKIAKLEARDLKNILKPYIAGYNPSTTPSQKKEWDELYYTLLNGDSFLESLVYKSVAVGLRSEHEQRIITLLVAHSLRDKRIDFAFIDSFMNRIPSGTKWRERSKYRTYGRLSVEKAQKIVTKARDLNPKPYFCDGQLMDKNRRGKTNV